MIVQSIVSSIVSPIARAIGAGGGGSGPAPSGDTIFAATLPADGVFGSSNNVTLAMGGVVTWTWDGFGSPSTDINTTINPEATPISFVGVVTPSGALLTCNLSGAVGEATGTPPTIPDGCTSWALAGADGIDFSGFTLVLPASLTYLFLQRGSISANGLANIPSFATGSVSECYLNNMGCVGWDGGAFPSVYAPSYEFEGCALTEATVDALLAAMVAAGEDDGYATFAGGTSAAPSAAGLADKATLITRGWSVSNN